MVFSLLQSTRSDSSTKSGSNYNNSNNASGNNGKQPIELSIAVESPPCVMYGSMTESTGALLSGVLNLNIKDPYSNLNNNKNNNNNKRSNRDKDKENYITPLHSTKTNDSLLITRTNSNNTNIKSNNPLSPTASNAKRKSSLFSTFSNLSITNSSNSSHITSISSNNNNNNNNNVLNNRISNKSSHNASTSSNHITSHTSNEQILNGYTKMSIVSVELSLLQIIKYHKPFIPDSQPIANCSNCKTKTVNLKTWEIQTSKQDKTVGKHSYPFSYLIPGSVPPTCCLSISSETQVKYELVAVVTYLNPLRDHLTNTSSSNNTDAKDFIDHSNNIIDKNGKSKKKIIQLTMPVPITRSVARGPDKNSLRVFPPTELTASAVLPNVIYPKSTFPLELKLDGISYGDRRWRMRKLSWRIEETTKVRASSCKTHKHNLNQLENEIKKKELERNKNSKSQQPIKRYGDIGPRVKVTLATPENLLLEPQSSNPLLHPTNSNTNISNSNNSSQSNNQSGRQRNGTNSRNGIAQSNNGSNNNANNDLEDEMNDNASHFIHPNDDALRQEISQQQQRAREEQIKLELAKNNSMIFTEETRILNKGEIKSGWKTDFDNNGKIELVTDIDCMKLDSGVSNPVLFSSTVKPYVPPNKHNVNVACDIQDPNLGIYVSHILAVEIVVAEETLQYANGQPISKNKNKSSSGRGNNNSSGNSDSTNSSNNIAHDADQRLAELSPMFANRNVPKIRSFEEELNKDGNGTNNLTKSKSSHSTSGKDGRDDSNNNLSNKIVSVPTGAARVLRMQFRLNITERSGLGISWDEEVPPIYQDVKKAKPPSYEHTINNVLPHYGKDTVSGKKNKSKKHDKIIEENDNVGDKSKKLENEDLITIAEDMDIFGFNDSGNNTNRSTGLPMKITPPPMAHHSKTNITNSGNNSNNGSTNLLTTVQSPQLENIISLQGNTPFGNNMLSPANTREVNIRNISELLDTDRITQ